VVTYTVVSKTSNQKFVFIILLTE